jgi:uncharacterized membrane protein YgcG
MKVRITTLLSLTGVLVAGSAAALVNTQVLSSSALRKSTASEISVADTQSPSSSSSATSPTTSSEVANKFAQLAPIITASASQTTFDVLPSGKVTLDVTNGVLSIVSVTPSADWTVGGSEAEEGHVDVKFQSATQLVEFKASLVAGQIVTSVESTDLTTPSSVSGTTQASVSGSGSDDSDDQNETEHHAGQTVSPTSGKSGGGEHSGGGGADD